MASPVNEQEIKINSRLDYLESMKSKLRKKITDYHKEIKNNTFSITDLIVKTHKLSDTIIEYNEELTKVVDLSDKKKSRSKQKNYHEKVKKYCYICSRSTHSTMDCYSKIPPQMKKEIILTNNLCLNCFEFGHKAKFCLSPRRCLNCKNKHHVFSYNVGVKHEFNQTTKQSTSKLNQQTKPMLTYNQNKNIQNVQNQKNQNRLAVVP